MRRNRRVTKKMSVMATNSMRFGAIIMFFVMMVILNLLSSQSCAQLLKQKGEMEREIAKLDDARMRESTRWEGMKTTENIDAALLRHGLSMQTPRPDQTVRLRPDGTPCPGQISIAKAKMRTGVAAAAVKRPATSPYRRARTARTR